MPKLMRALLTSYTRYFNTKYHQTGPLYESRYKASRISDDSYLTHITRYIHLNRNDWQDTPYSSIAFYLRGIRADWLRPERIMTKFSGPADYRAFIAEYIPQKYILDTIKHELAD